MPAGERTKLLPKTMPVGLGSAAATLPGQGQKTVVDSRRCRGSIAPQRNRRMSAPIPKNEVKRLKVLWQYDVLDTVPEEVFDDLTDLAAHICEAPIALISLVDEDR